MKDVRGQYRQNGRFWYPRNVKLITRGTVHHTATAGISKDADHKDILQAMMNTHVNQGWPGLSYHEVIMPDGTVYIVNDYGEVTWHDSHNTDSYSWALIGYFHAPYNEEPTKEQLISLKARIDDFSTNHPEFPADQDDIWGHSDRWKTACAGDKLMPYVTQYRESKGNVDWGKEESNIFIPVEQRMYTADEYQSVMNDRNKFWQERDTQIAQNKELHRQLGDTQHNLDEVRKNYTTFTVLGYETYNDLEEKVLKPKDEKIAKYKTENEKLKKDLLESEQSIENLSSEVAKRAKANSTVIDSGIKAEKERDEFEGIVDRVARELKTDKNEYNIIRRIDDLHRKHGKDIAVAISQAQQVFDTATKKTGTSTKSIWDTIMRLLHLG